MRLIDVICKRQKQHYLMWYGIPLCCIHLYGEDTKNHLAAWRRGDR